MTPVSRLRSSSGIVTTLAILLFVAGKAALTGRTSVGRISSAMTNAAITGNISNFFIFFFSNLFPGSPFGKPRMAACTFLIVLNVFGIQQSCTWRFEPQL